MIWSDNMMDLVRLGSETANEINQAMKERVIPQYLYSDLELMRKSNLIRRSFSDEKNCFVYSTISDKIILNLKTMEIENVGI